MRSRATTLDELAAAFHAKHEQTYGHANRAERVQLVNLRLTALGRLPDLVLAQRGDPARARTRARDVWFAATGPTATPVHWRDGLMPGTEMAGPAIIEAMDSTTVVPPGWTARVDELGYIRLSRCMSEAIRVARHPLVMAGAYPGYGGPEQRWPGEPARRTDQPSSAEIETRVLTSGPLALDPPGVAIALEDIYSG